MLGDLFQLVFSIAVVLLLATSALAVISLPIVLVLALLGVV